VRCSHAETNHRRSQLGCFCSQNSLLRVGIVNNYMLERVAINAFHHTISPNIDLLNITFLCQINLMYDVMNERVSLR
jgi:hypothetical protein